jgi:hypothetical protein
VIDLIPLDYVYVITGAGFLREVAGQYSGICVFAAGFDRMRSYEDQCATQSPPELGVN